MNLPKDLKYAREHGWIKIEGEKGTIGITDFAQNELGEIVYIELPSPGAQVKKDEPFGVVESVKAVSDLYSPVTGEVLEVNTKLEENLEKINEDPYGDAWMIRVLLSDKPELKFLLSAEEYEKFLKEEE